MSETEVNNVTDIAVLLKVNETLKSIGLHEHPLIEFELRLKRRC